MIYEKDDAVGAADDEDEDDDDGGGGGDDNDDDDGDGDGHFLYFFPSFFDFYLHWFVFSVLTLSYYFFRNSWIL